MIWTEMTKLDNLIGHRNCKENLGLSNPPCKHMGPIGEDSIRSRASRTSVESGGNASLEASFSSEQGGCAAGDFQEDMPSLGAGATSKATRPSVSPGTVKDRCKLCTSHADNMQSNFSYLKKDIVDSEFFDVVFSQNHLTDQQIEDIYNGQPRRRKVDVMVKHLLFNGDVPCKGFVTALSTTKGFQFFPAQMHHRHLKRSEITIEEFTISPDHINNNEVYIIDNVEPEEIADVLFEEYVINIDDHEEITNPQVHKSRRSKAKELIVKLISLSRDELNTFLYALRHTDNSNNALVGTKLEGLCEPVEKKRLFGYFTDKGKKINVSLNEKAKENVINLKSTKARMRLTVSDTKGKPLPEVESKVVNNLKSLMKEIDEMTDTFAKLSIKDIEKGSIVIHLQLESVQQLNRFKYAVRSGEVEHFVNKLLEKANVQDLAPRRLSVEVDLVFDVENIEEHAAKLNEAKKTISHNMAFLLEELNPKPILTTFKERNLLSENEIQTLLQLQTNRRLQINALLKILLSRDDEYIDHFRSALESGKQHHISDRLWSPRCTGCLKQKIKQHKGVLIEELDSITIRDTLDRCDDVSYDIYDDTQLGREERIEKFLKFIENSREPLLVFDDVLFAAGMSPLLNEGEGAKNPVLCKDCFRKDCEEYAPTKDIFVTRIEDNLEYLKENIQADELLDALVERGAMTYQNKVDILKEQTRMKMNDSLLKTLLKRGPDSCSTFADVIQEQTYNRSVYEVFHFEFAGGARMDEKQMAVPERSIPETERTFDNPCIKVVAAIDIGTTYSGFAYSFTGQTSIFHIKTKTWKATRTSHLESLKTPTTLLLNPDESFKAFGFEAIEEYSELAEDEDHKHWHYFKQFKMTLHNKKELRRDTKIKDDQCFEFNALDVFAHSIQFLKDDLTKHIKATKEGRDVTEEDIRWVLTVPAIWDEAAKQFMREAAKQAGIPTYNLILALEPEAASVYAKEIPVLREETESEGPSLGCFKPGSKYIVLDVGGGTVDTTVAEVLNDKTIKELHENSGGEWGGQKVNEAIRALFDEIYGETVMSKFEKDHRADAFDLELAIECAKRNVHSAATEKIGIVIPNALAVEFKKMNTEIDVPRIPPKYTGMIEIRKRVNVRIDRELFKDLFRPCIDKIINHAKTVLRQESARGVECIICVGGFSECEYLHQEIKSSFPNLKVIIPPEAGLAVLKGAVLYGQNPDVVSARVCGFTYGTAMHRYFMEGHDDARKRVVHDGHPYCKDIFHILAKKGCSFSVGNTVREEVHPVTANMTKMSLRIYKSTVKEPKYVTDEGCTYLGRLVVDMPDTRGGLDRTVTVSLTFGDTEIIAEGLDKTTNEKVRVSLDMLSNSI